MLRSDIKRLVNPAPARATFAVIRRAFEDAGIEFLETDGVRLKRKGS
jgi:hypothetical protein